jgi:hypothetical protein
VLWLGDDGDGEWFHVTVTFEVEQARTRFTMLSLFPTEARDLVVEKFAAIEGGR